MPRHVAHRRRPRSTWLQVARLVIQPLGPALARPATDLEFHHRHVAALGEVAVLVEHIGDAARHAGREVAARRPEHDHDAARHVFAAMVARALDDRDRAGVAHREALARDAAEVALARDGAVEHRVADDDRLLRHDLGRASRDG